MKDFYFKKPQGFSLLELLIVIAIIVILVSLALPTLAIAKESARAIKCRNNLYQISVASTSYSSDHNGHVPSFVNWLSTKIGRIETGTLYSYVGHRGTYMCPTEKSTMHEKKDKNGFVEAPRPPVPGLRDRFRMKRHPRDFSYAMNCGICHNTKLSDFKQPSTTVLYIEAEMDPMDYSGQTGLSNGRRGENRSILTQRHKGQGHIVFSDMHVEKLAQKQFHQRSKNPLFWFPTGSARIGNLNINPIIQ